MTADSSHCDRWLVDVERLLNEAKPYLKVLERHLRAVPGRTVRMFKHVRPEVERQVGRQWDRLRQHVQLEKILWTVVAGVLAVVFLTILAGPVRNSFVRTVNCVQNPTECQTNE